MADDINARPCTLEEGLLSVECFKTSHGSVYEVFPDGRTQRTRFGKEKRPFNEAIVFIPDYDFLREWFEKARDGIEVLGDNESEFIDNILDRIHLEKNSAKMMITDDAGTKLRTNKEIANSGRVFVFLKLGENTEAYIPVSKVPKLGYRPLETRREGADRVYHPGHEIIEIILRV